MSGIKAKHLREWLKKAGSGKAFKESLQEKLGVRYDYKKDKRYIDPSKADIGSEELNLRQLSEELLGNDIISQWREGPAASHYRDKMHEANSHREKQLFEDVVGVQPSVMQDINLWTATNAGLVDVKILEGYNSPEYIGDKLMETMPRRVNGGKLIGIPFPNPNEVDITDQGIEFPSASLNQLYVWTRENVVAGCKLGLDRRTVVYDHSGELMGSAEKLGKQLGWVREYIQAGTVLGMTNLLPQNKNVRQTVANLVTNSFRMNATADSSANPTYQTTGVTTNGNYYNYANKQTQALSDYKSLQTARNLLNLMRDPVNQLPFDTEIRQMFVDPALLSTAQYIRHQMMVLRSTGTPATGPEQGANSTFPPFIGQSPTRAASQLFDFDLHSSNIWHQVLLDGGVAETATGAQGYWYCGDFKKAFVWQQAWDLRTDQANPTDADMLSRNLVALWVTQWSGIPCVREPRYVIQNVPA